MASHSTACGSGGRMVCLLPQRPGAPRREYKSERDRLETFDNFPAPHMDVGALARAGFWYTHHSDFVCCAFCNVQVGWWEEGDDPWVEHLKWSKCCKFLKGMDVGNIPSDPSVPLPVAPRDGDGQDECGAHDFRRPEHEWKTNSLAKLGIVKRYNPAHPAYASLSARVESYKNWPKGIKLDPPILSEAGLFYTGLGDKLICFQCGGGLHQWEESDDPWRVHALHFPKCGHVVLTKGHEFIAEVLGSRSSELSSEVMSTHSDASSSVFLLVVCKCLVVLQEISALAIPAEFAKVVRVHADEDIDNNSSTDEPPSSSRSIDAQLPTCSIDDARVCKICYNEEIQVAFIPCGHVVSCGKCGPVSSRCVVCRSAIRASMKVYLA
ncbi:hypothetical protein ABFX02_O011700 [Erythranthe guttata]